MLTLHAHPLSSFCWKALIALYENHTEFEFAMVDQNSAAAFKALWPIARMPALQDGEKLIPEATIIIEYLDQHHRGPTRFIPEDPDLAREVRLKDRLFDLYVQVPMQQIVFDRVRPADAKNPAGVAEARALLRTACDVIERDLDGNTFAVGDVFTMADCAAAPALHYANKIAPLSNHPRTAAYLRRLEQRPSIARVLEEAQPYAHLFPQDQNHDHA